MGKTHPDLYKAFAWRFWHLTAGHGFTGAVLPRAAFVSPSMEEYRLQLLEQSTISDLTFLTNSRNWVFEAVHPQYTVALASYQRAAPDEEAIIPIRGPYPNPKSYQKGIENDPHKFPVEAAKRWGGSAKFPLLPSQPLSVEVFNRLDEHPRVSDESGWKAVPYQELNATNDRKTDDGTQVMHFVDDPPDNFWPIFKGGSFDIWTTDTGVRYAWTDPEIATEYFQSKREGSYRYAGSRSAFSEMSDEWVHNKETLPCHSPRIAFRDVSRRNDSRTVRPALIPPNTFLVHNAPTLIWPNGNERDEAYLLGVLCSIPLDWYSRRFVENHVTFGIFNNLPIPRPGDDSDLRQRVVELAGRLAAVDERYAEWADAVGVEYGPLDEAEQLPKIYELDAVVAHLYGLSREHLRVVFETFHEGWNYEERLTHVLEHYDEWADRLDMEVATQ